MSASLRFILACSIACCLFAGLAYTFDEGLLAPEKPAARKGGEGVDAAPGERDAILGTIDLFNRIYQDFYATGGNPHLIDEMPASKEVKHQLFRDLGYIRDSGHILVMDEAQSLPVKVVLLGDGRAEATVYEEWNYVYQMAFDRKPVTKIKGMGQGFVYALKRRGNGWEIQGWEHNDMPRPEPREGFSW